MKNAMFVLFVLVAILFQGCIVKSLHPFYSQKDVVFKPELLNTWVDDDGNTWKISRMAELPNAYEMEYVHEDSSRVHFIAHLFSLNNRLYVDFFPMEGAREVPIYDYHIVPAHSLARVEKLSGEEVRIKWFNERWLTTLFEQNRIRIGHEVIMEEFQTNEKDEKVYVLTAPTDELQKFILKYGEEDKAFDDGNSFELVLKRP